MLDKIILPISSKGDKAMVDQTILKRMAALSDETRLVIIGLLSETPDCCACELLRRLDISQGTLSHHMRILLSAGLVSCRKDGKWCHYTLEAESLLTVADFLRSFTKELAVKRPCHCQSK